MPRHLGMLLGGLADAAGILLEALAARSSDASTPADYTCRETHAHAALGTPGCGAGS